MTFERFENGKSADQVIDEVREDLERGFYEKADRDEAVAKLETARIAARPDSPERQAIEALLADIAKRYGDN